MHNSLKTHSLTSSYLLPHQTRPSAPPRSGDRRLRLRRASISVISSFNLSQRVVFGMPNRASSPRRICLLPHRIRICLLRHF
uniref:Uncharacterized protein n=1 Tax=Kalanchoe fedtschenkoi TaxID=63787 RepID=A0A7N0UHV1_KALFE